MGIPRWRPWPIGVGICRLSRRRELRLLGILGSSDLRLGSRVALRTGGRRVAPFPRWEQLQRERAKPNQREDGVDSGPNPSERDAASDKQQREEKARGTKEQREREEEERLERKQNRQEEQEEREEVRQEEREDRKRERQKARGQEEESSP